MKNLFFVLTLILSNSAFSKINVGVVDTGIDPTHPIFKNQPITLVNFKNFKTNIDENGHGSNVSGIIYQRSNISFNLFSLKNLDKNGIGATSFKNKNCFDDNFNSDYCHDETSDVIDYAIKNNIKILNFSQTYMGRLGSKMIQAYLRAEKSGILIIASTTNITVNPDNVFDSFNKIPYAQKNFYPCALKLSNIICVGNIKNFYVDKVIMSGYGTEHVDVFADGNNVYGASKNHSYDFWSGASMAAPKITAIAIDELSKNEQMSVIELKARIFSKLKYYPTLSDYSKRSLMLEESPTPLTQ